MEWDVKAGKKGRGAVGSLGFIERELYRVGRQGELAYDIWQRLEEIKLPTVCHGYGTANFWYLKGAPPMMEIR